MGRLLPGATVMYWPLPFKFNALAVVVGTASVQLKLLGDTLNAPAAAGPQLAVLPLFMAVAARVPGGAVRSY